MNKVLQHIIRKVTVSCLRGLSGGSMKNVGLMMGMAMMLTACSTSKNTANTRWYHAFTARYNTYYNGNEAYKTGVQSQEEGHKDNFTEMIPFHVYAKKSTAEMGKSNYETAIEKCEKTIKQHSIKRKPARKPGKKSEKEKAFLARKEFNPFLKNAWLLMAKAQMRKGDFTEAAASFSYINRLYANNPSVLAQSRALLAQCYLELDWLYDAEEVLRNMRRDSLPPNAKRYYEPTLSLYHLKNNDYKEAVPHLLKTLRYERSKRQRGRLYFLTAQVYQLLGENKRAYKMLKKCLHTNPPYEQAFNARVLMTEVMSGGQSKQMLARLKRMTKDPNNNEYLDQIYYAMGNIHLTQKDTLRAIYAYEKGAREATRSGVEKGVLLLHLGNLYWNKGNYIDAQRCYQECIGLIEKDHKDYKETARRSEILDEVAVPLKEIKLQDSLQVLAKLPEKERMAAIDRVIEELKKKEKEEKKKQLEQQAQQRMNKIAANGQQNKTTQQNTQTMKRLGDDKTSFYFYTPTAVSQGKQEFEKRWGSRKDEDNWRRMNKTVLAQDEEADKEETVQDSVNVLSQDSLSQGGATEVAQKDTVKADKKGKKGKEELDPSEDPHKPEYYIKDIPLTDEQLEASNEKLKNALFQAAVLEKERLEDFDLSYKTFQRLMLEFPDFDKKDEVYYHFFLLHKRWGDETAALDDRSRLANEYPDSKYATILNDPDYERNARYGKHLEDSLYAETYTAYLSGDYMKVVRNSNVSTNSYPNGQHRAKFLFLDAMSKLETNNYNGFKEELKFLVQNYPQSEVSEMAGLIVKGIESGRAIHSGAYDASGIWGRRTAGEAADSTQQNTFSDDRWSNYVFLLAYLPEETNEKQLLFEMARYNFTSFMVRNFDLHIDNREGVHLLQISGFRNYDEAHLYAQQLFSDAHMVELLKPLHRYIISEKNAALLGISLSYDDYETFYEKNFAPVGIPDDLFLDEPTEIREIDPEEMEETEEDDEDPDY
jgi:tetratricopeptide (TPR) repeat protein